VSIAEKVFKVRGSKVKVTTGRINL